MGGYLRGRVAAMIPVLIGVSVLVFAMAHLVPGDPVSVMTGGIASPETMARLRSQLGLDKPIYVQFLRYVSGVARGDLGRSIISNKPVTSLIEEAAPSTLQLTLAATVFAVVLGIPIGIIAAVWSRTWIDRAVMLFAVAGLSMPSFWIGLLLLYVFSLRLGWIPVTGQGGLNRLILPTVTLGYGAAAVIARLVRSSMLEILREEYIQTARAKGLSQGAVILRHALKNALIPTVTMVGLQMGRLLGGAVVVEQVFARQGLGRVAVDAILKKDFPVIQGVVLVSALGYVLINLIVDLCYAWLDPRISYE
jgi:ABC-type dipeptide/oligopeptide/nickel transport system permease component